MISNTTELCPIEHSLCNWNDLLKEGSFVLQSCIGSKTSKLMKKKNLFRIVTLDENNKPEYKLCENETLTLLLEKWNKLIAKPYQNGANGFSLAKEGAKAMAESGGVVEESREPRTESITSISNKTLDKITLCFGCTLLTCLLISRLCDTNCFLAISLLLCATIFYARNNPFLVFRWVSQYILNQETTDCPKIIITSVKNDLAKELKPRKSCQFKK